MFDNKFIVKQKSGRAETVKQFLFGMKLILK